MRWLPNYITFCGLRQAHHACYCLATGGHCMAEMLMRRARLWLRGELCAQNGGKEPLPGGALKVGNDQLGPNVCRCVVGTGKVNSAGF